MNQNPNAPLDEAALTKIEAITDAATPGPWRWSHQTYNSNFVIEGGFLTSERDEEVCDRQEWSNGEYIAASRTFVPVLIAELRHYRAAIADAAWNLQAGREALALDDADEAAEHLSVVQELLEATGCSSLPGRHQSSALAQLRAESAALTARAEAAKAERDALRAALSFYASEASWSSAEQVNRDEMFDTPVQADNYGDLARLALLPTAPAAEAQPAQG